jgi:Amt family ammonium transporter
VSNGKKFIALALLTFIVLIAVGFFANHHHGDPEGTKTGTSSDLVAEGVIKSKTVEPNAVGIQALADGVGHLFVGLNMTWLLMTGFLVLFMQVGFAFLVTGLTRAKNAGHMMMMNIAAFAVAFIAYYICGFAFQFGGVAPIVHLGGANPLSSLWGHGSAGFIGLHGFFLQTGSTYDVGTIAFFLFQVVFMETAGYIIIGAIAERINFRTFLIAEVAMGALIYPIYGMWVWGGGWLAKLGVSAGLGHGAVDFAGSGVVHATGGWAALALAMLLGPRIGKYKKDGTPRAFPGHNIGYVVIGTLILVFGWMGFNPGSTFGATDLRIAIVAVNTLISACMGFVFAMAWTWSKWGKPDVSMSCNGMLAGLVAITAPCAFVAPWAAAMIGTIAGVLVCYSVEFIDRKLRIDDPCGAISVHGVCGMWGVLAVGIFADGTYGAGWNGVSGHVTGFLYNWNFGQMGAQIIDVVVGFAWAWGITWIIFSIIKSRTSLRVPAEAEIEGIDMPEFGSLCYPDFVLQRETLGADESELEAAGAPVGSDREVSQ